MNLLLFTFYRVRVSAPDGSSPRDYAEFFAIGDNLNPLFAQFFCFDFTAPDGSEMSSSRCRLGHPMKYRVARLSSNLCESPLLSLLLSSDDVFDVLVMLEAFRR